MGQEKVARKLAAILYADVAGYSRLTGEDEVGTHKTLKAYLGVFTATIEQHGGRIVHFAGDAVLAEFSSVVDALTCAVSVQRALNSRNQPLKESQKLQFRVGINLGEVIFDDDEIYGDGVNIAARLESLADPGGIYVSQSVYDQVRNKVDLEFDFQGEQKVKNIADPVRAYKVILDSGGRDAAPPAVRPGKSRTPAMLAGGGACPGHRPGNGVVCVPPGAAAATGAG
ncbi:MAG: adenylate/guanylate cyclase domain-containing protein [Rhodospirillales bacterium]|nr:adenylate/guanylate cyclase domain-containing protein [Rhodospirillales bacterium]